MKPTKTLDDYQIESRNFLLNSGSFAALFDEPGCGKTGPAIMAGLHHTEEISGSPVLVTCPAYLIENWEKEIKAFAPHAIVVKANGAGYKERAGALNNNEPHFVLTSYNNWSATDKRGNYTYPEIANNHWSAMIFDEGHRLRNHQSRATKHVIKTRLTNATNKNTPLWILTGTPMVRDGGDFFIYFHLLDKKKYGSYWRFVDDRCITTETPWGKQVGNIRKSYTKEFQEELSWFSLRRTVKDIPQLQDLEYQEHEYFVTMPPSVIKAIKKAKKDYTLEHSGIDTKFFEGAGALYVTQRQIATNPPTKVKPKIDWLKDFLTDKRGRVVIYTWYKDSARLVHDTIAVGDRMAYLATGDMTAGKRLSAVDLWREDPNGVLVATIPALKEGISLTEANEVVFLEHSGLPSDIEQTIKRLCRRGQKKVVQVHHVHAKETVDMAIRKVLQNRNQGISEVLAKWIREDEELEDWFS